MLIIGEYKPRPKQLSEQAIRIVEKALIEHALTEGYELRNKAGTKTPTHEVRFSGFREAKKYTGERCTSKCLASKGCQPTAFHILSAF